ncbi:MAG TPA: helix-turn-helix domain-containing protein [Rhodospirillaceae bacterium]|nr:helix-turn-helix domain-containing protein [Rhodospirillaceae bacterium]
MIWEAVLRGSALVWFAQGAAALMDRLMSEEIQPNRIYGTPEAAKLMGLERLEVLSLIKDGKIAAKKTEGNYRILGTSILEYMSK